MNTAKTATAPVCLSLDLSSKALRLALALSALSLPLAGCAAEPTDGESGDGEEIATSAEEILWSGAAHAWLAENNANDAIGSAHGTLTNVSYDQGSAFSFLGDSTSYATFGSSAGNFGTSDFTIVLRLRTTSTLRQGVLGKRPSCAQGSFFDFQVSSGTIHFVVDQDSSGTNRNVVRGDAVINDGDWHLVALVRSGTTVSAYVDGVLDASSSTAGVTNISNTSLFTMGKSACSASSNLVKWFAGELDDVTFYHRALTVAEIQNVYPETCADIVTADPSAADGLYTLYIGGDAFKPWTAHCKDMSGTPAEYLPLVYTGTDQNFSQYTAGGASPGTSVRTSYTKVRIDPVSLLVDISDQTFSSSSGQLSHAGGEQVTSMPYGVATSCIWTPIPPGIGNIDLRGTPFAVEAAAFSLYGDSPSGGATYSSDDQVVDLAGNGWCGHVQVTSTTMAPMNDMGGFMLPLVYQP